jgi:hypothetical protein
VLSQYVVCVSFNGFLYLYLCISYVCVYTVLVQNVMFVSEECVLCSDKGKLTEECSVFCQRKIERRSLRVSRHFGYAHVMKLHKQLVLKCSCLHTFVFAHDFGLRLSDIRVLRSY